MSFHRSHPPTQSLRDASSAIGLRAEEQIARLSLLQSERLGPWALGWVLQHFPSASDFGKTAMRLKVHLHAGAILGSLFGENRKT